jgi:hypothetical protein
LKCDIYDWKALVALYPTATKNISTTLKHSKLNPKTKIRTFLNLHKFKLGKKFQYLPEFKPQRSNNFIYQMKALVALYSLATKNIPTTLEHSKLEPKNKNSKLF